ncbi:MAG TPA: carboxy terminal-processing peptidase, partial [Steroidobacteraceae bacterium]|nr:carboxy terminal-processing peptidase [Steroidobacteraceae bacterium]
RWSDQPVDGQLTVTIGKFYRVTGESTQHDGVTPDIALPSTIDMKEVGESSLEAALPWDRIQATPFTPWQSPHPVPTALLAAQEQAREQHDPDYRWLVQDVDALVKLRADKTISLNLKTREQERTQLDRERLARANERLLALGKPVAKTVEDLDKMDMPDLVLGEATQVMADLLVDAGVAGHVPLPPVQTAQQQTPGQQPQTAQAQPRRLHPGQPLEQPAQTAQPAAPN